MSIFKKLKLLMALNRAHGELMRIKSGWFTTEFWVSTLTIVAGLGTQVAGLLGDSKAGVIIAGVASAAYAISRGLAKAGAGGGGV